ncbi:MAG TPA: DUF2752 domain-containing protein [Phycisphaerales bacterium]|nr:DUF2752 domain-containing protein [Phycisphaerales bacterium]
MPALPRRADRVVRVYAGAVALACLGLLVMAGALDPSPAGHGTHEQLGLPPCGWALAYGRPCPTCGMTTAFAAAADGDLITAFIAQPFAALLALATAAAFWIGAYVALTGSRLARAFVPLLRPRALWVIAGAWGVSWAYKLVTWPGL